MVDGVPAIVSPAYYTGLFTTRVTVYSHAGGTVDRILKADPMRVFVRVEYFAAFFIAVVALPGPWPANWVPTQGTNLPVDAKFHDAPSVTQGEWYAYANGVTEFVITECLYVMG